MMSRRRAARHRKQTVRARSCLVVYVIAVPIVHGCITRPQDQFAVENKY